MKRFNLIIGLLVLTLLVPTCVQPQVVRLPGESKVRADPAPAAPTIRLPVLPVPTPAPVPVNPVVPVPLATNQLYVFDASVSCTVLTSPTGLLKVTADTGPEKIRGLFVDGTAVETRTYGTGAYKFIYIVESNGTAGKAELLIVPAGATGEGDVIRRCLDVGGLPPPGPPPPPVPPTPVPPTDPLTAAFQAAYTQSPDAKALTYLQTVYGGLGTAFGTTPLPAQLNTITTYAQVATLLQQVVQAPGLGLTATQVVPLRTAIAAEMAKNLTGTYTASVVSAEMQKVATALGGVK